MGIRKVDLVRESILAQLREAEQFEDHEEYGRLLAELAWLEAHKETY